MLGSFTEAINGFVFGIDKFFSQSESQTYVKDRREAVTHNVIKDKQNIEGRQCRYPGNYHDIVKKGRIQIRKDSQNNPIPGKYDLLFSDKKVKQLRFPLALVIQDITEDPSKTKSFTNIPCQDDSKFYFTIEALVGKDPNNGNEYYSGFYKPFEFSTKDLEKCLPVFEVENINADQKQGKDPIYKLTNSSVVTKKVDGQEVPDEECRNGKLLHTSYSGPSYLHAFAITDERGNLELAKSLFISVPIMFVTSSLKIFANFVTAPFMRIGEWLMSRQNPVVQAFGRVLRGSAELTKNVVNMVATIFRIPILLFTANKEKYSDVHYTLWKEQFKEYWNGIKNSYKVITSGKVPESEEAKDRTEHHMIGTWKELDARKSEIEGKLQKIKPHTASVETVVSLPLYDTKTATKASNGYAAKEEKRRLQRSASNQNTPSA